MIGTPERIVFLGTPALAVPTLRALHAAGYEIPLVVSRADKRRGRGGGTSPSPVKAAALELGLEVTDALDDVRHVDADLGVVVAYGRIIPADLLDHLAMVNLHFSLLPRWRGAAPVERAILAGDPTTGVAVMALAEGLDTGDVYRVAEVPIGPDETLDELRGRLVDAGTDLLLATLADGLGEPTPQVGEPVYAHKVDPAELELDWSAPADVLHRVVRLGGAWTTVAGKRLKIWRAELHDDRELAAGAVDGVFVGTGRGALELIEVQPEGKPRREAAQWANGARLGPDDRLGS